MTLEQLKRSTCHNLVEQIKEDIREELAKYGDEGDMCVECGAIVPKERQNEHWCREDW
jgi:formamidopyrimidine-DNA glycosylase